MTDTITTQLADTSTALDDLLDAVADAQSALPTLPGRPCVCCDRLFPSRGASIVVCDPCRSANANWRF